ncbi:MAG: basic amino acid ABC transporter substrate-binding protein [Anaerolineaceae bacterium]
MFASILFISCQSNAPKVRVVTDAIWPPFETLDETSKQPVGFDVDLMNAIAKKESLQIEFVNAPFDSALAGLSQCQYDAAISAITITDERKKSMLFSDPYFAAGLIVIVNISNTDIRSKDDLGGKKVGAMSGTTGAFEAQKILNVQYSPYDTIDEAFLELMNGHIDAVITDNLLAISFVGKNPTKVKTVGSVFTNENYGVAVCNKQPALLAKINQGLAAVKSDGEIDQLVKKWLVNSQ